MKHKTQKIKYKGKGNPNWKGGRYIDKIGRTWITTNIGQVLESHWIYLTYHQIPILPQGCVIHHKDLNPKNNDINNLVLMDDISHKKLHYKLNPVNEYQIERGQHLSKTTEFQIGHIPWNKGLTFGAGE